MGPAAPLYRRRIDPVPESGYPGEAHGGDRVYPPEIRSGFQEQIGQDRPGRRSQVLGQGG